MAISESHSHNLACRYTCILGFEFHCVVLFGSHLYRYAVLAFLGQLLRGSSSFVECLVIDTSFHTISDFENDTYIVYLIDQRDVLFCDLREWKQVVLVCPKHKLASPLTEGQSILSASKWNTVGIILNLIGLRGYIPFQCSKSSEYSSMWWRTMFSNSPDILILSSPILQANLSSILRNLPLMNTGLRSSIL